MGALCRVEIQHKTYHRLTKINHRFLIDQKHVFVKLKNFTRIYVYVSQILIMQINQRIISDQEEKYVPS